MRHLRRPMALTRRSAQAHAQKGPKEGRYLVWVISACTVGLWSFAKLLMMKTPVVLRE